MAKWVAADAPPWAEAKRRLAAARLAENQVQVAWVKLANVRPPGSMREHVAALERDTFAVLQQAKRVFPNLRIAYLGSRTYGGYASGPLNPEPYAFEGAFAVRGLIARQERGEAELALTKSPLLLWGPYLWADGMRGRKTDGLQWARSDFVEDGVHPSRSGRQKVAELLLAFFLRTLWRKRGSCGGSRRGGRGGSGAMRPALSGWLPLRLRNRDVAPRSAYPSIVA
jgi:lysophospholipase L1-like esterase